MEEKGKGLFMYLKSNCSICTLRTFIGHNAQRTTGKGVYYILKGRQRGETDNKRAINGQIG